MRRVLLVLSAAAAAACGDPIHERTVDGLGAEDPRVPVGPLHRRGQPCLACHGSDGPAESEFLFAGTVYQHASTSVPVRGARVRFIDSNGEQYSVTSNCAGNFYVGAGNYTPTFPVWTKVELGDLVAEMISPTFREGSCGACHADPATPRTVGHVYLADDSVPTGQPKEEACR